VKLLTARFLQQGISFARSRRKNSTHSDIISREMTANDKLMNVLLHVSINLTLEQ
jgi:hypothetical protein